MHNKNETELLQAEKKLNRIERWLKRCLIACRCGSWGAALAEIESMEAETRAFREDLWRMASEEACGRSGVRSYARPLRFAASVCALALAVVLAADIPLAVDQGGGVGPNVSRGAFNEEGFALVTRTENEILDALRQALSAGNSGSVTLSLEIPPEAESAPRAPGAAVASGPADAVRVPTITVSTTKQLISGNGPAVEDSMENKVKESKDGEKEARVEDIISLIQVGQNALRDAEPAIRVID